MAIANNIEVLRKARGWSRPELGKRMRTSGQQIERLEKGQRRLSTEWIERAAGAFEVDPAVIIAREPLVPAGPVPDQPPTRSSSVDDDMVEVLAVDLSFSMGTGTTIDDYVEETPVKFDLGFLRGITRTPASRLRLARGIGDSMFPTLHSSDRVMIDTTQRVLNLTDRIYAISLFGAAAIKRLRTVGPDRVEVISDNPTVENQVVDAENLFIAGRVIWASRDL